MDNLIPKHGGYKNLKSFQTAEIIFDLTMEFCNLYIDKKSRTTDQMQQAARSGKQNIAEGSQTSGSSKQSEIRLIDVARASLEELLNDYRDFLRTGHLPIWDKGNAQAAAVRKLAYADNRSYRTYLAYMANPETAANCLICLINQANYLLDQQLRTLRKELIDNGDFKDRYRQARKTQMINNGPPIDDFLKSVGMRRLENGKVVGINAPDK